MITGQKRRALPVIIDTTNTQQPTAKRIDRDASSSTESGIRVTAGAASDPGKKRVFEDRWFVDNRLRLYAIFDGHGGDHVSDYLQVHVADVIRNELIKSSSMKVTLGSTFKALDEDILARIQADSGSCAVVCIVDHDDVFWTANAGDCRAVLARKPSSASDSFRAIPLTKEHMPIYSAESTRIKSAGGFIEDGRVNGRLEVSRAFGDRQFKRVGVVATPYISHFSYRSETDSFVVMACDGLWKVMESQAVVDFIAARLHDEEDAHSYNASSANSGDNLGRQIARQLLTHAIVNLYAKDNVTIIIILLHPHWR